MSAYQRFHLAIAVDDLGNARAFYGNVLGFAEGRSSEQWTDFDMYGHQLVVHEVRSFETDGPATTNPVDGDDVPVPHFGVILDFDSWNALAARLQEWQVEFVIEPHVRFEGEVGEQHTMFFRDPAGNALEFKSFANDDQVFAR